MKNSSKPKNNSNEPNINDLPISCQLLARALSRPANKRWDFATGSANNFDRDSNELLRIYIACDIDFKMSQLSKNKSALFTGSEENNSSEVKSDLDSVRQPGIGKC